MRLQTVHGARDRALEKINARGMLDGVTDFAPACADGFDDSIRVRLGEFAGRDQACVERIARAVGEGCSIETRYCGRRPWRPECAEAVGRLSECPDCLCDSFFGLCRFDRVAR